MKNTKKSSAKNHVKDIKIFLKKRKTKGEKRPEKDIKILLKKKNQKSIRINHCEPNENLWGTKAKES